MSKEDGKWGDGNTPTKRGRSFKNKLLDVIREEALLDGVVPSSAPEKAERAFIKHFAERAFKGGDGSSDVLLKELLSKSYAAMKATLPSFEFDFDMDANPATQVRQLISASSDGLIPADVAGIFIGAVKHAVDIEQATEIKDRIKILEGLAGV